MEFTGDAKVESVLYHKVITSGPNQAGQIITVVLNLSTYIGDKGFPQWAESIRLMQRKTHDNFIPAAVGRSAYGVLAAGVFVWNGNALDTEDQYNRDMKIWDRSVTSVIRQWDNYVNNGEYIFLAIQEQVEPSLLG